jgi:hypothetical protein
MCMCMYHVHVHVHAHVHVHVVHACVQQVEEDSGLLKS